MLAPVLPYGWTLKWFCFCLVKNQISSFHGGYHTRAPNAEASSSRFGTYREIVSFLGRKPLERSWKPLEQLRCAQPKNVWEDRGADLHIFLRQLRCEVYERLAFDGQRFDCRLRVAPKLSDVIFIPQKNCILKVCAFCPCNNRCDHGAQCRGENQRSKTARH